MLALLPPVDGPAPMLLKQKVTMQARGERFQFLIVSRFDATQARLVALMPTGQQLIALEYDGKQLHQSVAVPVELPGEAILATIQFAFWPEASVRQHYPPELGWTLRLEANRRQLWHYDAHFLDIVQEAGTTRVKNYPGEYQVTIKTLEQKDLEQ
ncbi:MAG: DUF3261 domain-containing protein [Oceanospirillales bacterium]|nr:DUF3261 domain-containing protein [Oceanospirillales bacterium]